MKYDLMKDGSIIDSLEMNATPKEALDAFRLKFGSQKIDVCGVRIAQDGRVL
jgi:hypothetical protein